MTLPAGQSHNSPCLPAPSPCVWKEGSRSWRVGISLGGWLAFSRRVVFQAGGGVETNQTSSARFKPLSFLFSDLQLWWSDSSPNDSLVTMKEMQVRKYI